MTESVFSNSTKKVVIPNLGLEYQGTSDGVSYQYVDLQRIMETPCCSQNPNKEGLSQPSNYVISGSNPILGPPDLERESDSSCDQQISSSTPWYQLPGTVNNERDTGRRQSPYPKVHTTTLQDSRKDEPTIPDLNNQNQNNFIITKRVTFMLFVVTLFFVTYVISSMMLFLPNGIVRYCFRDFVLINHAINPVIYSIANGGFQESYINFVHVIRERFL